MGGSIPFLDPLVLPQQDGALETKAYRKPTHTDLYLQWDNHHTMPLKDSVISTIIHRAKIVYSQPTTVTPRTITPGRSVTKMQTHNMDNKYNKFQEQPSV